MNPLPSKTEAHRLANEAVRLVRTNGDVDCRWCPAQDRDAVEDILKRNCIASYWDDDTLYTPLNKCAHIPLGERVADQYLGLPLADARERVRKAREYIIEQMTHEYYTSYWEDDGAE